MHWRVTNGLWINWAAALKLISKACFAHKYRATSQPVPLGIHISSRLYCQLASCKCVPCNFPQATSFSMRPTSHLVCLCTGAGLDKHCQNLWQENSTGKKRSLCNPSATGIAQKGSDWQGERCDWTCMQCMQCMQCLQCMQHPFSK